MEPDTKTRIAAILDEWFERRVPIMLRDQLVLQYRWRGETVTVLERRPYIRDRTRWTTHPVARFRRDPASRLWFLDCRDRNGRWHEYGPAPPDRDFTKLLGALEEDETGIFWG